MAIILNVIFALSQSIPELDGSIARTRDDLSVIGAEADREDIGGVTNETTCRHSGVEIPEAEGVVPRGRERELAI